MIRRSGWRPSGVVQPRPLRVPAGSAVGLDRHHQGCRRRWTGPWRRKSPSDLPTERGRRTGVWPQDRCVVGCAVPHPSHGLGQHRQGVRGGCPAQLRARPRGVQQRDCVAQVDPAGVDLLEASSPAQRDGCPDRTRRDVDEPGSEDARDVVRGDCRVSGEVEGAGRPYRNKALPAVRCPTMPGRILLTIGGRACLSFSKRSSSRSAAAL